MIYFLVIRLGFCPRSSQIVPVALAEPELREEGQPQPWPLLHFCGKGLPSAAGEGVGLRDGSHWGNIDYKLGK